MPIYTVVLYWLLRTAVSRTVYPPTRVTRYSAVRRLRTCARIARSTVLRSDRTPSRTHARRMVYAWSYIAVAVA